MENKDIELKFTLAEVNATLQALGQMPYANVANLIAKIGEQARPQVELPKE